MGTIRILDQLVLREALPFADLIAAQAEAFAALGRGLALNPLRQVLWRPDRQGLMGVMPAFAPDPASFAIKAVSVFPGAHAAGLESHQGAVLLFEAEHGQLIGIFEGSELTARRTAAVSALATRLLAREDAGDLALLGAGVLAWNHLLSLGEVRRLRRVRIWNRSPERALALAALARAELLLDADAVASAEEAVRGADLICTLTGSAEPILDGAWLAPGAHVNAVGASSPRYRELATSAVLRCSFFGDSRESVFNESGDFLIPFTEGAIDQDFFRGELGQVLIGAIPGRTAAEEITLFKSLGLAIEDLAAARLAFAVAAAKDLGTTLPWTSPA